MICGIDEAGRGCVAGDLCVAGVVLNAQILGINDSKKISEKKREQLFDEIMANSIHKIVIFSAADIDKMGISACLFAAINEITDFFCAKFGENGEIYDLNKMDEVKLSRILGQISASNSLNFVYDGNCDFGNKKISTLIKADAKVPAVSAASILAKVTHDRKIRIYHEKYPQFNFAKNKGYASSAHIEAIAKFGYTEFHRRSYHIKSLNLGE